MLIHSVAICTQSFQQGTSVAIGKDDGMDASSNKDVVVLQDATWTLHVQKGSEDGVRIRCLKASLPPSTSQAANLEYRGQQVGKTDGEGNVTLQEHLLTIKDDPFEATQGQNGVRRVDVLLQIPLGSRWKNVGAEKPTSGKELTKKELAEALKRKSPFEGDIVDITEQEWNASGLNRLRTDNFIKSGDSYFQPNSSVRLELHFRYVLAASYRVRLPSPEATSPCCATFVKVTPDDSIVCAIDNSEEQVVLNHSQKTTIRICAVVQQPHGQRLMVLHEGKLTDAIVVASPWDPSKPARHRLSLPTGDEIELDLNEFNHCNQRLASTSAYEAARASFCDSLRDSCATVQDAITGTQLRVEDQTLQINPDYSRGVQRKEWVKAPTIKALAPLLMEPSSNRPCGAHESLPALIEAPPGTGKVRAIVAIPSKRLTTASPSSAHPSIPPSSGRDLQRHSSCTAHLCFPPHQSSQTWSSYQLGHSLATLATAISSHGLNSVPILMFVQRLASLLKTYVGGQKLSLNIIMQYTSSRSMAPSRNG